METNYKIIGGDGREYGPVTLDEIKGWIRDGRIGRTTQIWRSDLGSWHDALWRARECGGVRISACDYLRTFRVTLC